MNIIKRIINKLKFKGLTISKDVDIIGKCSFADHTFLNPRVIVNNSSVGRHSYINCNSIINVTTIGNFSSIGPNVICGLGKHPTRELLSTSPAIFCKGEFVSQTLYDQYSPVYIGNDVWIGANVTILNGVTINNGAIIGANSVVTKDIPPYSICCGIPAKVMRYRFPEYKIKKLQNDAWWNMTDANIKQYITNHSHENTLDK